MITIGNNVQITANVAFFTHGGGHVLRRIDPKFDMFGKIKVNDGAYIGAHSLIMPGVVIGEGALVAAGSVVTKSVAPRMVVGGNPAKVLCSVDDFYERNKPYNLGTKGMSSQEKRTYLLSLPENKFLKK